MPLRVVRRKRVSASQRSKNRRSYRRRKSSLRRYARKYRRKASTRRRMKRISAFKKRRHLRKGQRIRFASADTAANIMENLQMKEDSMNQDIKKLQESIKEFTSAVVKPQVHFADAFKAAARTAQKLEECYSKIEMKTEEKEFSEWDFDQLPGFERNDNINEELEESFQEILGIRKPLIENVSKEKSPDVNAKIIAEDLKQLREQSLKLADLADKGHLDETDAKDFLKKAHKYLSEATEIISEDDDMVDESEGGKELNKAYADYADALKIMGSKDHGFDEKPAREAAKKYNELLKKHGGTEKNPTHMPLTMGEASVDEKVLSSQDKGHLPDNAFVFQKERKYPIHDISHARNALARVAQHGTKDEQDRVRAVVHAKYPEITKENVSVTEDVRSGSVFAQDNKFYVKDEKTGGSYLLHDQGTGHNLEGSMIKFNVDSANTAQMVEDENLTSESKLGIEKLALLPVSNSSDQKSLFAAVENQAKHLDAAKKKKYYELIAMYKQATDGDKKNEIKSEFDKLSESLISEGTGHKSKIISEVKALESELHKKMHEQDIEAPGHQSINFKVTGYDEEMTQDEDGKKVHYPEMVHFNIESHSTFKMSMTADGRLHKEGQDLSGPGVSKGKLIDMVLKDVKQWAEHAKNHKKQESIGESVVDEAKLEASKIRAAVDTIGKMVEKSKLSDEEKKMADSQLSVIIKVVEAHEESSDKGYLNAAVIELCMEQLKKIAKGDKDLVKDMKEKAEKINDAVEHHEKLMKEMEKDAEENGDDDKKEEEPPVGPEEMPKTDDELMAKEAEMQPEIEEPKAEESITERHGSGLEETHPEWDKAVKELVEKYSEEIKDEYELYSFEVEGIERKSRDGFISYNDGGYRGRGFAEISQLIGSGQISGLPDKAEEAIEKQYEHGVEIAQKQFIDDNKEALKGIPADKINYHDLYDMKKSDLAEKLSELENEMNSGDDSTVMFELLCMYDEKHNHFTVQGVINWEAPYHRSKGAFEDYTEEEVEIKQDMSAEQIKALLEPAIKKAVAHMGV